MSVNIEVVNTVSKGRLPGKKIIETLNQLYVDEGINDGDISVVIVDDFAIRELNKKYLRHDYATDVLAFKLEENRIEGDIYISCETAANQASEYNVSLTNEILRLAIHGALHIIGYDDKTDEEKKIMTEKENKYLELTF